MWVKHVQPYGRSANDWNVQRSLFQGRIQARRAGRWTIRARPGPSFSARPFLKKQHIGRSFKEAEDVRVSFPYDF